MTEPIHQAKSAESISEQLSSVGFRIPCEIRDLAAGPCPEVCLRVSTQPNTTRLERHHSNSFQRHQLNYK